ncbi:MAG: stage III sporulation protein AF [Lachnospiraceae bacterium]
MEAVYEWIRQIAVFAVVSYLVLYLMGEQEKRHILRIYLSLMMLLLILKPAVSVFHLDQILTEKLTELTSDTDTTVTVSQIRQAAQACSQEILDCTSESALTRVRELAENKNLKLEKGTVDFDEEKLEQSGEVIITGMDLTVSGTGKQSLEVRTLLGELKKEVAETFELDQYAVSVKWKN